MPKTRSLEVCVREFSEEMLSRLKNKEAEGWRGWDSRRAIGQGLPIKERMISNVLQGDWIDVANLAMIAWNLEG
jgi:hypothetical protein